MSLKIVNGYAFKRNMTLLELNDRMIQMRCVFKDVMQEHYRRQLVNMIYLYEDMYQIDKTFALEMLKNLGPMDKIWDEKNTVLDIATNVNFNLRDRVEQSMYSSRQSPGFDYSAEIQLYPLPNKILFQFFGENWIEDILQKQEDIMDYHYQNQTDRPDDLSEEEWEQRYADWKEAMPTWIPAKSGFGINLFLANDIPIMMEDIFKKNDFQMYRKSMEKRLNAVVERYFTYPKFNGQNWDVFCEDEYKVFKQTKAGEIKGKIESHPDPVELLYKRYCKHD